MEINPMLRPEQPPNKSNRWVYTGEAGDWALIGLASLLLLLVLYAPAYGIPFWIPLALLSLALIPLLKRGFQAKPTISDTRRQVQSQHMQKVFGSGLSGLILGLTIAVSIFVRDWTLFLVLLPASLTAGILLYLASISASRIAPFRFLVVPLAGLILGGLLWLALPKVGYVSFFLLCNAVLSFGLSVWLHWHRQDKAHI
jgi:hypothetical protein